GANHVAERDTAPDGGACNQHLHVFAIVRTDLRASALWRARPETRHSALVCRQRRFPGVDCRRRVLDAPQPTPNACSCRSLIGKESARRRNPDRLLPPFLPALLLSLLLCRVKPAL